MQRKPIAPKENFTIATLDETALPKVFIKREADQSDKIYFPHSIVYLVCLKYVKAIPDLSRQCVLKLQESLMH